MKRPFDSLSYAAVKLNGKDIKKATIADSPESHSDSEPARLRRPTPG